MGLNRYLVCNAFICGAVIMVVELLGSRIIGPPFGVSLFVWTSLITVTLVSLALGYWLGGRLADRKNSHSSLIGVILIAGLWVALVPLIKGFVIGHTLVLGLRAGSLACSAALFGPPLFLLGMVSPYTVKLYMDESSREVGKTVGWLYAVSTCGSFLGTVLTGFILLPGLGVNNITYLSALTLIAISAGYWVLFRKKALATAFAIVPIALLFTPQDLPSMTRPDGTKVSVLLNDDSAYGQIKVVDYEYGNARLREFLLVNMIQGAVDLDLRRAHIKVHLLTGSARNAWLHSPPKACGRLPLLSIVPRIEKMNKLLRAAFAALALTLVGATGVLAAHPENTSLSGSQGRARGDRTAAGPGA